MRLPIESSNILFRYRNQNSNIIIFVIGLLLALVALLLTSIDTYVYMDGVFKSDGGPYMLISQVKGTIVSTNLKLHAKVSKGQILLIIQGQFEKSIF